jgi:membrane AbrB-like protein
MNRQWIWIGSASLLAGLLAERAGLPAAWLIGPMLATLVLSLARPVREAVPPIAHLAAQAVIGIALSASFEASSLITVADYWPVVLATVGFVLLLSLATGMVLAWITNLDPATAFLGTIPGGASGMVAMSDELHADPPLVAFMQYARLIMVGFSASLLARFVLTPAGQAAMPHAAELAGYHANGLVINWPVEYALTAAAAVIGAWAGLRFGLPAGALVGPVILGVGLGIFGIPHGVWPPGVLPAAYALIGIWTGSRFDVASIRRLGRLAPMIIAFVLLLMACCALLGWGLALATGIDPLSAYLATTPGGIDAVTVAALDTGANTALILPVQMIRLVVMVLAGPLLVRWLTRRHQAGGQKRLDRSKTDA